ncbi:MAG: hypothetical protein Q7S65_03625 [Nanoarchaeota archaeon]|nr:hypothetical protein [Nanoarchaeota archaeon]
MAFTSIEISIIVFAIVYLLSFLVALFLVLRRKDTHPLAKAAFLIAYLGLVPALNYVTAPLAILLGRSAQKDIKEHPRPGNSLAVAAVYIGAVVLAVSIIGGIVFYLRSVKMFI